MKKLHFILLFAINFLLIFTSTAQEIKSKDVSNADIIEVYYFHFTNRCMTCNTVESVSKESVESLYPEQIKSGAVVFKSVNLDDDGTEAIAKKFTASGQGLIILNGSERVDLTTVAFMNAVNNPDKLKAAIKKNVDAMID